MTAPVAASIVLPSDSSNSGKQLRTQTKSINAITVHEQFVVPSFGITNVGKYFFSSTQQSVSATVQDGIATGFFWMQMPLAATVTALIRNIHADASTSSTTAAPTAPVLSFNKFTFTGTASGAAITPVKFQTAGTTAQMIVRTAVTGMTVTLTGDIGAFSFPCVMTGTGTMYAEKQVIAENPQAWTRGSDVEIGPGEGLVIYQSVAGTAADPRRFTVQVRWMEIDLT
jgi:hypothetical protein